MYKSYSLYGQATLGDVVVARATVANFSLEVFEHFT